MLQTKCPTRTGSAAALAAAKASSCLLFTAVTLAALFFSGCGDRSASSPPPPLNPAHVNLIFVVSPDLAYQAPGDVDPTTANLTPQGLQRSLLMATYLKQEVLGGRNVTAISALEPMTHLQTANRYPDMAAIGYIQQFALLNEQTIAGTTANSYPIGVSYGPGPLPGGVAAPVASTAGCRGLAFGDGAGDNLALAAGIIDAKVPGFYLFSAPWETISALLSEIKAFKGYDLDLPAIYRGPNTVYAVSITPSGLASLTAYEGNLNPPATYPVLPAPVAATPLAGQTFFSVGRTGGVDGAVIPANINTDETVYIIRHAEAHPTNSWENGNYVGAGQWRSLALPSVLKGKIAPTQVYSSDPGQVIPLSLFIPGASNLSYVRPSLTVLPYAIANNLPFSLVAGFSLGIDPNDPAAARATSDFFFTGGNLSHQSVLVAWEHKHIPPFINALLASYGGSGQSAPSWPDEDYDTLWTVTLDNQGNVTVHNALFQGIDSAGLPASPPRF